MQHGSLRGSFLWKRLPPKIFLQNPGELPLTADAARCYLTALFIYVRTNFSESSSLETSRLKWTLVISSRKARFSLGLRAGLALGITQDYLGT